MPNGIRTQSASTGQHRNGLRGRVVVRFLLVGWLALSCTRAISMPPIGPDGWTVFSPSLDTRIVYVSSTLGTDWINPRWYRANDAAVGGDPFRPVGSVRAYNTIGAAYNVLRDGKADWILLKRGDAWDHGFDSPQWTKSGIDSARPMVIGAYMGLDEKRARPIVTGFRTRYGPNDPEDDFDFVAVTGIQFTDGITRLIGGDDFLIEDCMVNLSAITIQGEGPDSGRQYLTNVAIRRSVVFGNYSTSGHAQNVYVSKVRGLNIEECVFDHGGWNEDIEEAEPTVYNHNVYLQKNTTDVVFRRNISSRASSHGVQMRRGGLCEDNLFLQNPISILIGSNQIDDDEWPEIAGSGIVRENVILDSRDIDAQRRGHGMWFEQIDGVEVFDNVVAHQQNGSSGVGFTVGLNFRGLHLRDNIVHDWTDTNDRSAGIGLKISNSPSGTNLIHDNHFQQTTGGEMIRHNVGFSSFQYANNVYFSANEPDDLFTPGGSLPGWRAASGEVGAVRREVEYLDPSRTIESYMASLGRPPTLEEFLRQARKQNRLNWRPTFTANAVNSYIREGFNEWMTPGADSGRVFGARIEEGTLLKGALADLHSSDGQQLHLASLGGESLSASRRTDLRGAWIVDDDARADFTLSVDSSVNQPACLVRVYLRNWNTRAFDLVSRGTVGVAGGVVAERVAAAEYVRADDGRVEVSVRHHVLTTFGLDGLRVFVDRLSLDHE